jgi:hypothetical protein
VHCWLSLKRWKSLHAINFCVLFGRDYLDQAAWNIRSLRWVVQEIAMKIRGQHKLSACNVAQLANFS